MPMKQESAVPDLVRPMAGPRDFDLTAHVHPDLRPFVPILREKTAQTLTMTLAERRKAITCVEPAPSPPWAERDLPGAEGQPDVRVYVINSSRRGASRPALLHMHGGGFVRGTAMASVAKLQPLAAALDCVIVTVDYRLAPETAFPGALNDNYTALSWLYRNASELGVDRGRIAVMGESAGGGHAAMLALAARDRGDIPILHQCLVYPMLDDRTHEPDPAPSAMGALVWTPEQNREAWTALLGGPAGGRHAPEGAVPGRVADLAGLPATYIAVGSIDLFVRENLLYALRLMECGVTVELEVIPGAFHGFEALAPEAEISKRHQEKLISVLRYAFGSGASAKT